MLSIERAQEVLTCSEQSFRIASAMRRTFLLIALAFWTLIPAYVSSKESETGRQDSTIRVGAERLELYLPSLQGKRVGLVCNHASLLGDTLLLPDALTAHGVNVVRLFTPEHGLTGTADAGEHVKHGYDAKRRIEVISLYHQMRGIDVMVFDLQDVGVRCYTYVSTLQYVIDACIEYHVSLIVLDRPNPNGHYVAGPVLQPAYRSFVGMHTVPWVHGLTMGEFARMIQGEWLPKGPKSLQLTVIPCSGYTHATRYMPPVPPSPNLPNEQSILLYPTLALFEGTTMSVGRGTDWPFQVLGSPDVQGLPFTFTPRARPGATQPPYLGKLCRGIDLRMHSVDSLRADTVIRLELLQEMRRHCPKGQAFFNTFFTRLTGTPALRKALEADSSADSIRASWQNELTAYRRMRAKYLLYPER